MEFNADDKMYGVENKSQSFSQKIRNPIFFKKLLLWIGSTLVSLIFELFEIFESRSRLTRTEEPGAT